MGSVIEAAIHCILIEMQYQNDLKNLELRTRPGFIAFGELNDLEERREKKYKNVGFRGSDMR